MLKNTYYTTESVDDLLNQWTVHREQGWSQRSFCEEFGIPRSTFQGWLRKQESDNNFINIPAAQPVNSRTANNGDSVVSAEARQVLGMLINELNAIVSDLDELVTNL
jgi:hypothetical protein